MLSRIASLLRMQQPVQAGVGLLFGSGDTVPPDATVGYQTGCIFQHTDGAHGTCLYVNEGDAASSAFFALDVIEGDTASSFVFDVTAIGPCISTADGYDEAFIETGTYASTADEGIVISETNNRPVSFLFDDGGDEFTGGDIRAGLFRICLTVDQTNPGTINALRAQIKAINLVDITSPNVVVAPLTGYIELDGAGARHLDGHIGCVRAALETGAGAHTVDINLCGFESTLNSSGSFTADKLYAYAANISNGTTLWQVGYKVVAATCDVGVDIEAVATGIAIGACTTAGIAITGATTYALDIATSGVFRMGVQDTGIDLTTTYPFAIDVQCEANADIVAGATGSTAGIYARYAIETAQTSNTAKIGIFGKLRIKADMADGNHAGVMGWVEISGTTELAGIGSTVTAAGSFAVIAPSTLDLSTGHLNGIVVDCSVDDAATIGGTLAGIRLKKSAGCYAWPTGIQIEDSASDIGLAIGTCTTGISVTGVMTPNSTRTDHALMIGGRSTAELDVTFAGGVGAEHFEPVQMNYNLIGTNPASTSTINLIQQGLYHDTADMANLRLKCADWWVTVNKDCTDVYVMQGEISVGAGTNTISGETAVLGLVLDGGAGTLTNSSWRVINCTLRGAGTPANSAGIFINQEAGCGTVDAAIRIGAGATMTSAFRIGTPEYTLTPTHLFQFPASGTSPIAAGSYEVHGGTMVRVSVLVGGVQYYMLASTAPTTQS